MQLLKTYHGPSHSPFIEMVIVGLVLFQWQYQSLYPAMDFGLWVSGINLGVSGHCNVEQLVSPDPHPRHLKGAAVFPKTTIPLCLNTLMIMFPHCLVVFVNPFQLSLVQNLPLLSLQEAGTLSQYFLWAVCTVTLSVSKQVMQSLEAVSISESTTSSWTNLSQMRPDHQYSSNFLP